MTMTELDKLFVLFSQYFKNSKKLRPESIKKTKLAWWLAIEPYKYDEVRAAVAIHVRDSNNFPDINDITSLCTAPAAKTDCLTANGYKNETDYLSQMREAVEMVRLMDMDYSGAGIPHPADARKLGWSAHDWIEACDRKGISVRTRC